MPTTTTTISAPTYLQPGAQAGAQYLQDLAARPYTPYTEPRVAGLSPLETQAFDRAANYQLTPDFGTASGALQAGISDLFGTARTPYSTPGEFGQAAGIAQSGAQGLFGVANTPYSTPGEFGQASGAANTGIQSLLNSGLYKPQQFSAEAANYYMDPYIKEVLDIQRREANTEFQKQQSALRARAASAGAFGGSRATLLETESQRGQNQLLDDILAKGLSSAYSQGREQFNADQVQRLEAAKFGQRGAESALQGANILSNIGSSRASADNQALQVRQSALANAIQGANTLSNIGSSRASADNQALQTRQSGFTSAMQGAASLGNLASNIDSAERARFNQLADFGLQQRQQQQANLDAQYQQFLDERDYPLRIADVLTGGISRLQGNNRTETSVTPNAPTPSTFEQLLGGATGIAGLLGTLGNGNPSAGLGFLGGLLPDNILGSVGGFLEGLVPDNLLGDIGGFLEGLFD